MHVHGLYCGTILWWHCTVQDRPAKPQSWPGKLHLHPKPTIWALSAGRARPRAGSSCCHRQCSTQAAEIRIKELHTLLILLRRTEFTIKLTFLNITSDTTKGFHRNRKVSLLDKKHVKAIPCGFFHNNMAWLAQRNLFSFYELWRDRQSRWVLHP